MKIALILLGVIACLSLLGFFYYVITADVPDQRDDDGDRSREGGV